MKNVDSQRQNGKENVYSQGQNNRTHSILISYFGLLNSLLKKIVTPEESLYPD